MVVDSTIGASHLHDMEQNKTSLAKLKLDVAVGDIVDLPSGNGAPLATHRVTRVGHKYAYARPLNGRGDEVRFALAYDPFARLACPSQFRLNREFETARLSLVRRGLSIHTAMGGTVESEVVMHIAALLDADEVDVRSEKGRSGDYR